MAVTAENARRQMVRRHRDIFTAKEAAEYLGLSTERSLETIRKDFGLVGHRPAGSGYLYWRKDLDRVALKMFGIKEETLKTGASR